MRWSMGYLAVGIMVLSGCGQSGGGGTPVAGSSALAKTADVPTVPANAGSIAPTEGPRSIVPDSLPLPSLALINNLVSLVSLRATYSAWPGPA